MPLRISLRPDISAFNYDPDVTNAVRYLQNIGSFNGLNELKNALEEYQQPTASLTLETDRRIYFNGHSRNFKAGSKIWLASV